MFSRLETGRWCLFLDDHYLELGRSEGRYGSHGLTRVMHRPTKQGLVVTSDRDWESPVIEMLSSNIIYDEKRKVFRLWYNCFNRLWYEPLKSEVETAAVYYAESSDGRHWTKPELGQFDAGGSKRNNICLIGEGCGAGWIGVMEDPHEADPQRRFKMLGHGTVGTDHGVVIYFSPDGLRWRRYEHCPVMYARVDCGDSHCFMGQREPGTGRFVASIRPQDWYLSYPSIPTYRYDRGNPQGDALDASCVYRKIGISFSDDFTSWTPPQTIIQADLDDPPGTQIQGMTFGPYEDAYLGYLMMHYADGLNDTVDIQLAVSRDLTSWRRVGGRAPFLTIGDEGPWHSKMIFSVHTPFVVDDELYFYYNAHATTHYAKHEDRKAAIGLATLPNRRIMSMYAAEQGFLVTRPFQFDGREILIDADTTCGEIAIEILDERFKPLLAAKSLPMRGDDRVHRAAWSDESALAGLNDKPVRLKFHMQHSHLYGFKLDK